MATRTKYGTKEALGSAKQSSRTAVAGGSSVSKLVSQLAKLANKPMSGMGSAAARESLRESAAKIGKTLSALKGKNIRRFLKSENATATDPRQGRLGLLRESDKLKKARLEAYVASKLKRK